MEKRRGPWSGEEKKFIEDNHKLMSSEEIAEQLGRNADVISKYIEDNFGAVSLANYDIKKSIVWRDIKAQFDDKEQELFIYHWNRMINQFQNDVYATEQMQIVDAIKFDLLMNRCLAMQKENLDSKQRLGEELREISRKLEDIPNEDPTRAELIQEKRDINMLLGSLDASIGPLNKDFREYSKKKEDALKSLKSTREQRYEKIRESKQQFGPWLAELIDNVELRTDLGIRMEKMRIASDKVEFERLTELHKYEDGVEDFPFYTPEVALREKEKQDKEIQEELDRINEK